MKLVHFPTTQENSISTRTIPLQPALKHDIIRVGCTITQGPQHAYDIVTYPQGTQRIKLGTQETRYKITLLNGAELREIYHKETGLFLLWVVRRG